jgi:flagellar basal body-associated protein FliL
MGCGEFLPPPIGQTPYDLGVPQQQKKGLSVPIILLIISIVLLVAMGALFLLLIAV